nr:preprotein translocase subunit SecG [Alkaliphilus oremlandii]
MRTFLMILQAISCLVLIGSVMLQPAKSEGLSSTFGGTGAQMMAKQSRGYDALMSKVTKATAVLFIIFAIALVAIQ